MTTPNKTGESGRINLGRPFRVGVGRHTDNVYILQGDDLTTEEINGTISPWSPGVAVGDLVRIKPHAVHGLTGMIGEVESIYLSVDGGYLHVYGVRTMGSFVLVCEADLEPAVTTGALSYGASVGVFLDPPYAADTGRDISLYNHETEVSAPCGNGPSPTATTLVTALRSAAMTASTPCLNHGTRSAGQHGPPTNRAVATRTAIGTRNASGFRRTACTCRCGRLRPNRRFHLTGRAARLIRSERFAGPPGRRTANR